MDALEDLVDRQDVEGVGRALGERRALLRQRPEGDLQAFPGEADLRALAGVLLALVEVLLDLALDLLLVLALVVALLALALLGLAWVVEPLLGVALLVLALVVVLLHLLVLHSPALPPLVLLILIVFHLDTSWGCSGMVGEGVVHYLRGRSIYHLHQREMVLVLNHLHLQLVQVH